ncbi:DUF2332 domain-containing protein [Virgibacillus senegalensis]|uniref:DUF2332 domain-containing protein n=1 Tax=Virgibacillus senegalensis TaxID=1499679 RepID=UPI00069D6B86|nr:DUF2332 domain-containing protein [Virgibacillus senegalensis]
MTNQHYSVLFLRFSVQECKESSGLYECLAKEIAGDEELLQLCEHARVGQPVPNLLLGAVHYLLPKGDHPLQRFYASLTSNPDRPENAFPYFKDFCQSHLNEIRRLLASKLVQTNEVGRCAYLYPAFCYMYEQTKRPLALVELGSSAGLQLIWDKYAYRYQNGLIHGNQDSPLILTSEVKTEQPPALMKSSPPVTARIGLDLHINNLEKSEDYHWLKALIWPEHHVRRDAFEKASALFKEEASNIQLVEGNGVELLEETVKSLPSDSTVCVFHTHVANQIPEKEKQILVEGINRLGKQREVFHLYNNMQDRLLHLDRMTEGKSYRRTIGRTDGHGRWFEWLLSPLEMS